MLSLKTTIYNWVRKLTLGAWCWQRYKYRSHSLTCSTNVGEILQPEKVWRRQKRPMSKKQSTTESRVKRIFCWGSQVSNFKNTSGQGELHFFSIQRPVQSFLPFHKKSAALAPWRGTTSALVARWHCLSHGPFMITWCIWATISRSHLCTRAIEGATFYSSTAFDHRREDRPLQNEVFPAVSLEVCCYSQLWTLES